MQSTISTLADELEVCVIFCQWIADLLNELGVPVITQNDPRTENYGVANTHTMIRHCLDPSLANTLQHRFMPGHNNILSEVKWSIFRRDFVPGFEDILQQGVDNGWYDINDVLEK